jgi:hypothetical protein
MSLKESAFVGKRLKRKKRTLRFFTILQIGVILPQTLNNNFKS